MHGYHQKPVRIYIPQILTLTFFVVIVIMQTGREATQMTMEERAEALENDILSYIRHLRAAEKLSLTVHLMQFNPYRHMDFGNLYTVHPNPLCVFLKDNVRLMDHCIERQTKVV